MKLFQWLKNHKNKLLTWFSVGIIIVGTLYASNYIKARPIFFKNVKIGINVLSTNQILTKVLAKNDTGFTELLYIVKHYNKTAYVQQYAVSIEVVPVITVGQKGLKLLGVTIGSPDIGKVLSNISSLVVVEYSLPCFYDQPITNETPFSL